MPGDPATAGRGGPVARPRPDGGPDRAEEVEAPARLVVVANGAAGRGDRDAVAAAVARLAARADVHLVWTASPDELDEVVVDHDDARLVVAGGDGSLHAAVNALARTGRLDRDLAVLPLGTGNDLASGIGLGDVDRAGAVACGTHVRRLDLLDVGDRVAVNAVHLGLGARAARQAGALKARLGPLAYPLGSLRAGLDHDDLAVRVAVDGGEPVEAELTMVVIANGWRIGGGFPVAPAASPADGRLVVLRVAATGRVARVRLGLAGRRGALHALDAVEQVHATRVVVEPLDGCATIDVDGELVERDRLEVVVRPAALRLVVPG